MLNYLWLIPITPFIGFLLNGLFGKRAGKGFVTAVAILASLGAAVLGTAAVLEYNSHYHHGERHLNVVYEWFNSGAAPGGAGGIGAAMGVTYQDSEELKAGEKERSRDKHRWELDPASSEDYQDRVRNES